MERSGFLLLLLAVCKKLSSIAVGMRFKPSAGGAGTTTLREIMKCENNSMLRHCYVWVLVTGIQTHTNLRVINL